jgi:hypothetical protein
MTGNKTALLAFCVLTLALAGCQSSRMPSWGARAPAPAPLPPAPTGTVQSSQLPPPDTFPSAPEQQVSAADLEAAAASAPEVSQTAVVGSWKTSAGGVSCQMFLTLTKYGANSRGGTRGCQGELSGMRSWNVAGKQLHLYDENGAQIATLYSTGAERFEGRTASGQPVSLSR